MSHKIFKILDNLGLVAQNRLLHVQFSNPSLNQQVFLQRIEGEHTLNQGSVAELLCLSTNAHIALKQFIGCQVAIDQVTDMGQFFRTTGIITEASQCQSDGSLTIYNLTLKDPTALWHKRRNSRVFMNKSVRDISEILFKEWQGKSPLFASSLTLFGAVIVKDGKVIASGVNQILTTNDPTAHAELLAIRAASQVLGTANLEGCSVFASGHPCPMCMAAMRLAGIKTVHYAYSNEDGAPFGLSTAEIYADLAKPFAEQTMKIEYVPVRFEGRTDLYVLWKNYQSNQSGLK